MLDQKQITALAVKSQTTELNILREYLQHRFLSYFYQQEISQRILFKGGTCLRLAFNSPRFSEDLDFSSFKIKTAAIEGAILETLSALEKETVPAELKEAKTTGGGYLALLKFSLFGYSPAISLEVSLRKKIISGQLAYISSQLCPPYSLWHLNAAELVNEKIQALLTRQKPRDFFDLYFLLRSRLVSPSQKANLKKAKQIILTTHLNFSSELKQFLPLSLHPLIKNFKKVLLEELKRNAVD